MSTTTVSMVPIVRAAAIEPDARRHVALVMASMHDEQAGRIAVSIGNLASAAGMSKSQARKHVHALLAQDILEVTANAHGGAPGAVPHYRFNPLRLQALAARPGCTADIFDAPEQRRPVHHFISEGRASMVAQLAGSPGHRCVRFFRKAGDGLRDYGQVQLAHLLRPWRLSGCWDAVLYPVVVQEDDFPEEIFPGEFEKLQQWAQAAALGRIESVIEA